MHSRPDSPLETELQRLRRWLLLLESWSRRAAPDADAPDGLPPDPAELAQ